MAEAALNIHADELEAATDEAIAAFDGDVRAAVTALLAANAELEAQVTRLSSRVSTGYARGRTIGR
ncbi:hypothetical protein [Chenggangzhangella methanolivorans]|uniref:Uncharacterized protein n=1 Tax=Chenggangzhangella methanolivorans TaxID=1437009 RepID=A0A9E6R887_9HYPH|nr:hypothetical protein [Chenggangzhangella methanolivorans]QZO00026.1 hypothetical protein K6K41_26150 [Chenggangzhangella methanolivorans]